MNIESSSTPYAIPLPSVKQNRLSPLYQFVHSRINHQLNLTPDSLLYTTKLRQREQPILQKSRKTTPLEWLAAILCMLFILLIIFLGIAILIIFLTVQPKKPDFNTPAATLGPIFFNSGEFINGDIMVLANFSNPNRKLHVRFEYVHVELYFTERLVATQGIQPFSERPGEGRLISIHFPARLVYLPVNLAMELQRQQLRNRLVYNMKGAFRVRVHLGALHYSYWLHSECQLEMTPPPNGVLISHSCRTKR